MDASWGSSRSLRGALSLDQGPGIQRVRSLWLAFVRPGLSLDSARDMGLSQETQLREGLCLSEGQGQEKAHGSPRRLQRQVDTRGGRCSRELQTRPSQAKLLLF